MPVSKQRIKRRLKLRQREAMEKIRQRELDEENKVPAVKSLVSIPIKEKEDFRLALPPRAVKRIRKYTGGNRTRHVFTQGLFD